MEQYILQAALDGLEAKKNEINARISEINREMNRMLRGKLKREPARALVSANGSLATPRKGMSLAGRKRIAAAQRERWARIRAAAAKANRTAKAERKYQTPPRRRKPANATVAA